MKLPQPFNTRPKFVASRTLDKVKWNNSILLKGEVAQEVAKLKAQEGGEIQVHGRRVIHYHCRPEQKSFDKTSSPSL